MKKRKFLLFAALALCSVSLAAGCQKKADVPAAQTITPQKAKQIMDTESGYVILDVRTEEEFAQGHIKGALLLPDFEVTARAERLLPDKNQKILVYCRSGRRSARAAAELARLGYADVLDFGGILDWEYETVRS